MILALDIGNTHIVMGCMEGRDIRYLCRMATNRLTTGAEYAVTISRLLEFAHIAPDAFDGAIISSVVPQVTRSLSEAVKMLSGIEPMVVGPDIRSDLTVCLDDPATLGSDLLVAAVGALDIYQPPLILVDMGTATTVTVVDADGAFRGGAIIPGVQLSLSALASHTSLLPSISLDAPPQSHRHQHGGLHEKRQYSGHGPAAGRHDRPHGVRAGAAGHRGGHRRAGPLYRPHLYPRDPAQRGSAAVRSGRALREEQVKKAVPAPAARGLLFLFQGGVTTPDSSPSPC